MRNTIFRCLGVAAVAFALQFTPANVQAAGLFNRTCSPCDEVCNPCDDTWNCAPCDPVCGPSLGKWFLNGHMEAGFMANAHGQKSVYEDGFVPTSGNTALLANTPYTGAQINQVYLSMGKKVDGRRGLDIGGTVDFTWGSDAWIVQAGGLEKDTKNAAVWRNGDYYSAFPQAYVEAAYGRWNVIAGKFYAPFGSSQYKSTENFFYTWAPTAVIAPHVGGGAYASYKASDRLTLVGGWVMPDEIGRSSENNAILGGVIWTPSSKFNVRYTFATGTNKYAGNIADGAAIDSFVQTLLITQKLSKKLTFVVDWTLVNVNVDGGHAAAYGINNEFIYQASKNWAFGTRFGMLNANEAYALGGEDMALIGDWYNVSIGANWTPNKWLVVKPELRYDWTEKYADVRPFNGGTAPAQFSGGMSAVVKF